MKYKLKSGILALVMCCLAASCQSEYDIIDNGVYLTDAQSSSIKRVTIDNTGAKTAITSRLGALSEQDVVVNYGFDPQALIAYNRKMEQIISFYLNHIIHFLKIKQLLKRELYLQNLLSYKSNHLMKVLMLRKNMQYLLLL